MYYSAPVSKANLQAGDVKYSSCLRTSARLLLHLLVVFFIILVLAGADEVDNCTACITNDDGVLCSFGEDNGTDFRLCNTTKACLEGTEALNQCLEWQASIQTLICL